MLYRKNGEWAITPFKVRYTEHGEEKERYTSEKQWWIDLAAKWEHVEIVEFTDVVPTAEQGARLEEIKNVGGDFGAEYSLYVETGEISGDSPALQNLKLKKENEELRGLLADLTEEVLLGGA